jgi:2-polyprenyl-3-methyl-5-hydroxy-6-metoxy-1,4-benzoquinol methylase
MITAVANPHLTSERIYMDHPEFYGRETVNRHLARYSWAASKLKSTDMVLDAGCGSGYGSFILLGSCGGVMGVDLSQEAIDYAWRKAEQHRWPKIEYRHGDLSDLKVDEVFDVVVCIEVIEHLCQEKQEKFMKSLKDVLSVGGHLIITTPAKSEKPMTEYHLHEFKRNEFKRFLKRYFKAIHFDNPKYYGIPSDFMLAVCSGVIQ